MTGLIYLDNSVLTADNFDVTRQSITPRYSIKSRISAGGIYSYVMQYRILRCLEPTANSPGKSTDIQNNIG